MVPCYIPACKVNVASGRCLAQTCNELLVVELDQIWTLVCAHSHRKLTTLEFVWSPTETNSSKGSWCGCWSCFGPQLSMITLLTPAQGKHTEGENEPEFELNTLNSTGVKTP